MQKQRGRPRVSPEGLAPNGLTQAQWRWVKQFALLSSPETSASAVLRKVVDDFIHAQTHSRMEIN